MWFCSAALTPRPRCQHVRMAYTSTARHGMASAMMHTQLCLRNKSKFHFVYRHCCLCRKVSSSRPQLCLAAARTASCAVCRPSFRFCDSGRPRLTPPFLGPRETNARPACAASCCTRGSPTVDSAGTGSSSGRTARACLIGHQHRNRGAGHQHRNRGATARGGSPGGSVGRVPGHAPPVRTNNRNSARRDRLRHAGPAERRGARAL